MLFFLSPFLLFSFGNGQIIEVPTDDCTYRGTGFGHHISCESNEIAIGACSSAMFEDCGGHSHRLKCCKMDEFAWGTCESHHADWGHHLSCPEGKFVETMCASRYFGDCNSGGWTDASCCLGYYNNKAVEVNSDNCSWQHGGSGEDKWCVGDQPVLAGICGSGSDRDCDYKDFGGSAGSNVHGILCCEFKYTEEN